PCELLCVKSFDSTTSNIYFFALKSRYTHQPRPVSFDISSNSSATFLNRDSHFIFLPLPRFGAIMKLGIFLSGSSGFRKFFSAYASLPFLHPRFLCRFTCPLAVLLAFLYLFH